MHNRSHFYAWGVSYIIIITRTDQQTGLTEY